MIETSLKRTDKENMSDATRELLEAIREISTDLASDFDAKLNLRTEMPDSIRNGQGLRKRMDNLENAMKKLQTG